MKPPGRRVFSYIDLVVLLLLGLAAFADVLMHASQSAATVQPGQLALVQLPRTSVQTDALAIPALPSSREASSPASDPCIVDPTCVEYATGSLTVLKVTLLSGVRLGTVITSSSIRCLT